MPEKLRIPLSFDETISAVLKVKPPEHEKPKARAKKEGKRPGRKPKTARN